VPAGTCKAIPADVSTDAGCRTLAEAIGAHFGGSLHVLVNNSGVSWGAPLADFPEAQWDRVFGLNVKAPFQLTRALLPQLKAGVGRAPAPPPARAAAPPNPISDALPEPPPLPEGTVVDPSRVINIGSIVGLTPQPVPTYS
jgi:NAD(P)-dependent dehydrogenase (short-subunit alcohol dehydrogenase family)